MLVPIRLDISFDSVHFQDTFCWSASETPAAAEKFATVLCQENGLPQTAVAAIVSAIQQQTQAYSAQGSVSESLKSVRYELGQLLPMHVTAYSVIEIM